MPSMDITATRTLQAPTRGMGPARRRSFARVVDGQLIIGADGARAGIVTLVLVGGLAVVFLAGGCIADRPPTPEPISTVLTGELLRSTVRDGPPIECRGLPRDRCLGPGSIEGTVGDVEPGRVARVVVSCAGSSCGAAGGAMRVDLVLRDGSTVEVARGGYGALIRP